MNALALARQALTSRTSRIFTVMVALVAMTAVSFAQAATPVPLEIPVNDIFESTNTWMSALGPVVGLGVGISVALAVLTFLGNQIVRAFRGGGS